MFDRFIQLLMLFVSTMTLIVTLIPPPVPASYAAPLYAYGLNTGAGPGA